MTNASNDSELENDLYYVTMLPFRAKRKIFMLFTFSVFVIFCIDSFTVANASPGSNTGFEKFYNPHLVYIPSTMKWTLIANETYIDFTKGQLKDTKETKISMPPIKVRNHFDLCSNIKKLKVHENGVRILWGVWYKDYALTRAPIVYNCNYLEEPLRLWKLTHRYMDYNKSEDRWYKRKDLKRSISILLPCTFNNKNIMWPRISTKKGPRAFLAMPAGKHCYDTVQQVVNIGSQTGEKKITVLEWLRDSSFKIKYHIRTKDGALYR